MSACTLRSSSEGWCGNCDWEYVLKTNKTEESMPDESCMCVYVCVYTLFFYLCHSVKYQLEKLQDALLSNLHESDKYSSLISFLFSFCPKFACA